MKISLRKLKELDLGSFSKWMRDEELLRQFFPGVEVPSKEEILLSFVDIMKNKKDMYFMILNKKSEPIGMISLLRDKVVKDKSGSYKMQVFIGEKEYWYSGCDVEAMKILVEKLENKDVDFYLEVRPENEKAVALFTSFGFVPQKIKKYPKDNIFPRVLRMDFDRKNSVDFFNA
ncbi:MAG: GNAT family N-acetyltransferase [Candidatus Pacebacteria bacterium]|nr:GNAT family N-acetyltransferase [Candidatus Paceibacterota bacterium]